MKILIDTHVLIELATRTEQYAEIEKLINGLAERDDASLWVSAISLAALGEAKIPENFSKSLLETFSIIPFRKSSFESAWAMNGAAFSNNVLMASAEEMGMDYLITQNKDPFAKGKTPALTPSEFLEKWNKGDFDTVTQVPFMNLKAQHHQIYNEIDDRMTDIIANTGFILGKHVQEFEEKFAEAQDAKYCIGVSSGTDALHVALLAWESGTETGCWFR